jgi:dienelactone hydrolase
LPQLVSPLGGLRWGADVRVETDGQFPVEKRHESEAILKSTKVPYQINLYSGVSHGFALRADLSKRLVTYAKEQAFLQAVFWFDEHVKA